MAHSVIIGGLGASSGIAVAHLNKSTGQLTLTDNWLKAAGPSPAFIAWNRSSCSSTAAAVANLLIANHAAKNGEAVTAVQLYPPYAKQTGSTWTDDPCHIAIHPSGRCYCSTARKRVLAEVMQSVGKDGFQQMLYAMTFAPGIHKQSMCLECMAYEHHVYE